MKLPITKSLKKLEEKPWPTSELILFTLYLFFVLLSIKREHLFTKELALSGLIILFAIVGSKLKSQK